LEENRLSTANANRLPDGRIGFNRPYIITIAISRDARRDSLEVEHV
jgi:hypothetical protein